MCPWRDANIRAVTPSAQGVFLFEQLATVQWVITINHRAAQARDALTYARPDRQHSRQLVKQDTDIHQHAPSLLLGATVCYHLQCIKVMHGVSGEKNKYSRDGAADAVKLTFTLSSVWIGSDPDQPLDDFEMSAQCSHVQNRPAVCEREAWLERPIKQTKTFNANRYRYTERTRTVPIAESPSSFTLRFARSPTK